MIFILIAGSYAPFCLISLNGFKGWILFGVEILIAVLGVSFKLIWFNCPRWVSTIIYVVMGWGAIFLIVPLYKSLSTIGLMLLVGGGVFYTIGAITVSYTHLLAFYLLYVSNNFRYLDRILLL